MIPSSDLFGEATAKVADRITASWPCWVCFEHGVLEPKVPMSMEGHNHYSCGVIEFTTREPLGTPADIDRYEAEGWVYWQGLETMMRTLPSSVEVLSMRRVRQ